MIGSEGTLGIITAATLKIYKKPSERIVLILSTDKINETLEAYKTITKNLSGKKRRKFLDDPPPNRFQWKVWWRPDLSGTLCFFLTLFGCTDLRIGVPPTKTDAEVTFESHLHLAHQNLVKECMKTIFWTKTFDNFSNIPQEDPNSFEHL